MKINLLIIDPQLDFVDTPGRAGSLAVQGAYDDCRRIASFIQKKGHKLNDIIVTLDSHHIYDVSHPLWWHRPGKPNDHPDPIVTTIAWHEVGPDKAWVPFNPAFMQRMIDYLKALEANNRYQHRIWPEHCIIGEEGYALQPDVVDALRDWSNKNLGANPTKVTKGSNVFTEHFSAVQAEVPDMDDPTTQLNTGLIKMLKECDQVVICGEALSHCVANTVRDIANNFGTEPVEKLILLEDCSSNVPTCEFMGEDFLKEMKGRGMKVVRSTDYL